MDKRFADHVSQGAVEIARASGARDPVQLAALALAVVHEVPDSWPAFDLIPQGEIWVEVCSTRDDLGRVQFSTYRADANQWRGGSGWDGQVRYERLGDYEREMTAKGWTVKVLTAQAAANLHSRIAQRSAS